MFDAFVAMSVSLDDLFLSSHEKKKKKEKLLKALFVGMVSLDIITFCCSGARTGQPSLDHT